MDRGETVKESRMLVTGEIDELRSWIRGARQQGRRIGCVPTMGALHAGHLSLVEECRKHVDDVVVTIFVNPSQFAPHEDLAKYPRPLERDLQLCREAGASHVFTPEVNSLYPPGFDTWVNVENLSIPLEGAVRPTHFRGVTTIVCKLFNIVQPDVACFGAKDYQQQTLIRRMTRDLDLPIQIVVGQTVREPDGLAMSSRNVYLSPEERQSAVALSRVLNAAAQRLKNGETDVAAVAQEMYAELGNTPLVTPDYAVICDPDSLEGLTNPQPVMVALVAAKVGQTRLIDNLTIQLAVGRV